jgi:hypothetical protein
VAVAVAVRVGFGVGVGVAVASGARVGVATGAREGVGSAVGIAAAVAVDTGPAVSMAATAVDVGLPVTTGSSIPPRCSTNPNEIAALSTRMRRAASVARGMAARRLDAGCSTRATAPFK